MPFSNRQFVAVFGGYSHRKERLTIVAVLATVAAENGNYRGQRWQQFVAFLAIVFDVTVIVAKNGVVEKA